MISLATPGRAEETLIAPVIDISASLTKDPQGLAAAAREIDSACRNYGFLAISGHRVPADLIDRVDRLTTQFFDQPTEAKQKYVSPNPGRWGGYSSVRSSALGSTTDEKVALPDLRESFSIGQPCFNADDPYYVTPRAKAIFTQNVYPEWPDGLKEAWNDYYVAMEDLAERLMRLFAQALGLPQDWFADKIDRHTTNLVLSNYPDPSDEEPEGQMRAGAHTDYGTLTILRAEDKPGGLEILTRGGRWARVPIIPGSFVVNIGDLMARWTNDRWVSTMHRVAPPPPGQGRGSRRLSLTFFHQPNWDALVECIPTCLDGKPARYAPILSGDHFDNQMRKIHETKAG